MTAVSRSLAVSGTNPWAALIGTPWARGAQGPDAFDCWAFAAHICGCGCARKCRHGSASGRASRYLLASGRLLIRLETWVTREEGPQVAAIRGEQAKRGEALQPLGTVDWEKRPPELTPTIQWEELKNLL